MTYHEVSKDIKKLFDELTDFDNETLSLELAERDGKVDRLEYSKKLQELALKFQKRAEYLLEDIVDNAH